MFDYLQKFNSLPKDLRESVSSPVAMSVISDLEKKYKIDLAATVMKIMVKTIPLTDLPIYLVSDFSLDQESAKKLTAELKERLFFSVANYLGYNPSYLKVIPKTTVQPAHLVGVDKVIKESGVVFPGSELNARFRNILATYIKGVRSRIDTRLTLSKEISAGGLSLDNKIIDKIFKSADEIIAGHTLGSGLIEKPLLPKAEEPKSGLEKVRALYEKEEKVRDIPYDLKTAILSGAVKKPSAPLNLPNPKEASEKLLEEPEEQLKLSPVIPVVNKETPLNNINKELTTKKEVVAPVIIPEKKVEIKIEEKKITPPVIVKVNQEELKTENKTPVTAPSVKINIPTAPITPVVPVTEVAKVAATNIVASIPVVTNVASAKIVPPAAPVKTNNVLNNKIVRPPEKKPGFFAKLFHLKNNTKTQTASGDSVIPVPATQNKPVTPVVPVVKPITSNTTVTSLESSIKVKAEAPKPSIASLRNEATAGSVLKETVREEKKISFNQDQNIPSIPKVMGPIEEISYLDLTNFRRLGSNPKEVLVKVESKIKNLEKDGYDKMVLGVVAWRNGLINSLYLKMAQEALSKELTLKQLADNYRDNKKGDMLFWEEIEEIISLNNRLMF